MKALFLLAGYVVVLLLDTRSKRAVSPGRVLRHVAQQHLAW
jgi:hypothetical protein